MYAESRKTFTEKLKKYKQELSDLRRYLKAKRGDTYWSRVTKFVNDCQKLFDTKGSSERIKAQENLWKVKMTASDHEFYNNQCLTPQIGYYKTNINAKWDKTQKRKVFDNY